MNTIVFGANGQIGQQFIRIALENGDNVRAVVRREGALTLSHPNLEVIVADYTNEAQLTELISGQDSIVSTLGPSLKGKRKSTESPIRDAHALIVRAMKKTGVSRLITLGTPTMKSEQDKKQVATVVPALMPRLFFPPAHAEMKGVEKVLKASTVDWTVVRIINPNTDKDGKGYAVSLGDTKASFTVSRKNIAQCMYDAIQKTEWIRKMPIVFNK